MKSIRIILFILIIIGIASLCTQKIWVSWLVNKILLSEKTTIAVPSTKIISQANIILIDGRQCYTFNHEATKDALYTVNEFIDITIVGTIVTGTKKGTQAGPDMTNGYNGTIVGTLSNNKITDIFSYVVEGSKNKEKEIYRAGKTGIEKLRYPLIEEKGILVPDTTKEPQILLYDRVGCTAPN